MNDGSIQLPDFLIADLYKQNLVITDDQPKAEIKLTPPEQTPVERKWYLGSNLQKITLVVSEDQAVYLAEESLQFLSNILGACKLNLGHVAIINYHNEPVDYSLIKEKLEPAFVILFGITAAQLQLPFTIPHYQVQKYDARQFLLAPSLERMLGLSQEAKLEKSKLWLCLRKMFNV